MERVQFVGTGVDQEVNPGRIYSADRRGRELEAYARKSRTHMWIVVTAYQASDNLLDTLDGKSAELGHLDSENLVSAPSVGCMICEQPYEPRARRRRCPGVVE